MPHNTEGPIRLTFFGDSLTAGYGLRPDEALPAILEQMLREDGTRATCLNYGVSGDTSADGLARINSIIESEPDAVVLEFGANDCFVGAPVEEIRANFTAIIKSLQKKKVPILLIGIKARTDFGYEYKAEFDPLFQELAGEFSLPLFPDILSCYLEKHTMTLMDGMHPNEQGVEAIAQSLFPQVKALVATITR